MEPVETSAPERMFCETESAGNVCFPMEKRSRRRLGAGCRGFKSRHSDQNCGIVRAKAAGIVSLRLFVFPMTEQQRHAVHGERIAVRDHVGCVPGKAGRAAVAGVGPGADGVRHHVHGDDLGGDGLAGGIFFPTENEG